MIFNPNAEALAKDKLRALPKESLQNIIQYVYNNVGLSMEVCLCNIGDLPRSEGSKLNRIIDNRNIS